MKTVSSCILIPETYNYLNTLCLLSYFWLLFEHITLASKNTLLLSELVCSEVLCARQTVETNILVKVSVTPHFVVPVHLEKTVLL